MGKNPNAARNKKNHHKDKDDGSNKMDELILEAARLGCEVWEVEELKKKEQGDRDSDESGSDAAEETKQESKPTKKAVAKPTPQSNVSEEEEDSDDAELAKMFGKPNKKAAVVVESDSEEEMPKPKKPTG